MTTAEIIADIFNNDGSLFEIEGQTIAGACEQSFDTVWSSADRELYVFNDGSAIFISDDGWNVATSTDGGSTWTCDGWGVVARVDAYGRVSCGAEND